MNLAELAEQSAERLGERMNLVFEGEQFTNFQFLDWARRLHRGFAGLGLARGDIAVLCMANHPLAFAVFQGIFRTGGTAIPVMFMMSAAELRYVLSDSKARGVITDEANVSKVREAVQGLDHIRWMVVLGGEDNPGSSPPEYRLETFLDNEPETNLPQISEDDPALMLYTAGTTGKPKGVMLTHANLIASAEAANEASELDRWEGPYIGMSAMPMAHIFGVGVMNSGYLAPEHIADGYSVQMSWFEPERFMQLIEQHRCTVMVAVPTMLALILNHPRVEQYNLSSLKMVVCGASPLPVEMARAFSERYGCRIREIYGLTENTGLGSANRLSEPYRPGSAGRAYFNTELKIFDQDDKPLPANEIGEVVMRGPAVMKGYYNRPEETAEALRHGWLHTGDMGYLDEDGYLFIVDRKKDMIIRGGENIYPGELEEIIYAVKGVAEAAVVGVPDPIYGESVIAFVVPGPGANLSEQEITDFMRTRTASFKVPAKIHFTDSLPKSPVGKVLKRELRKKALVEEEGKELRV